MPTAPRESSVNNRRPTHRPHRPYPMEETQGRRTGIKYTSSQRNSDGMEDFGGILAQLDNQNVRPLNVPRKKETAGVHIPLLDEDEDRYEIDDDLTPPPASGFARQPLQPSSIQRNYRSARSPVDYGELPTGPPTSHKRKSEVKQLPPPRPLYPAPEPHYDYSDPVPISDAKPRKSATKTPARRSTPGAGRSRYDSGEEDDDENNSPGVGRRNSNVPMSARMSRGSLGISAASRKSRASEGTNASPPTSLASRRSIADGDLDMDIDQDDEEEVPHSSFADLAAEQYDDFGGPADEIPFADDEPDLPSAPASRRKSKSRALSPVDEDDDIEVPFAGDDPEDPEEEAEGEEENLEEEPAPVVSSRSRSKQRAVTPIPEDEEEDRPLQSVRSERKQRLATPARKAAEDDDEEEEEDGTPTPTSRRSKSKGRASEPAPEEEELYDDPPPPPDFPEDEPFSNPASEDQEPPVEPEPSPEPEPAPTKGKKGKKKRKSDEVEHENAEGAPPAKKTRQKRQPVKSAHQPPIRQGTVEINQDRDDAEDSFDEQSGLRRGRRTRYRPLDWWRLERVEYGPGKHLAEVKKIITLPKEPPKPLGGKRRAGSRKPASRAKSRAKSRASDDENDVDPDVLEQARMERWNPEEGWDKDTKADCSVYDTVAKMDVIRRIAFTEDMLSLKSAENDSFSFQKVFNDGEFLAAGILEIPAGGAKPSRSTKDNTYVFYMAEGAAGVTVHNTHFYLCQGGMLMVPSDNLFSIDNPSDRVARLFFCQARKGIGGTKPVYTRPPRSSVGASSDAESYRRGSTSARA